MLFQKRTYFPYHTVFQCSNEGVVLYMRRILKVTVEFDFRSQNQWYAIPFLIGRSKLLWPMTVCLLWWYEGRFMVAPHCERTASMIQISNSTLCESFSLRTVCDHSSQLRSSCEQWSPRAAIILFTAIMLRSNWKSQVFHCEQTAIIFFTAIMLRSNWNIPPAYKRSRLARSGKCREHVCSLRARCDWFWATAIMRCDQFHCD